MYFESSYSFQGFKGPKMWIIPLIFTLCFKFGFKKSLGREGKKEKEKGGEGGWQWEEEGENEIQHWGLEKFVTGGRDMKRM